MSGLRFLSACSGLEGASLATEALGWSSVGFAEIEPFPSAIIAARYGANLPSEPLSRNAAPNLGDFSAISTAVAARIFPRMKAPAWSSITRLTAGRRLRPFRLA